MSWKFLNFGILAPWALWSIYGGMRDLAESCLSSALPAVSIISGVLLLVIIMLAAVFRMAEGPWYHPIWREPCFYITFCILISNFCLLLAGIPGYHLSGCTFLTFSHVNAVMLPFLTMCFPVVALSCLWAHTVLPNLDIVGAGVEKSFLAPP